MDINFNYKSKKLIWKKENDYTFSKSIKGLQNGGGVYGFRNIFNLQV